MRNCPHWARVIACDLKTQPNEARCAQTRETHILQIPVCCPVSDNPRPGSELEIEYTPGETVLEVVSLRAYVDSYQGGRGDVRSMEGMIQQITQDCANVLGRAVWVRANLVIEPGQRMRLECSAFAKR